MIALKCRIAFLHENPGGREDGQTERERDKERSSIWLFTLCGGGQRSSRAWIRVMMCYFGSFEDWGLYLTVDLPDFTVRVQHVFKTSFSKLVGIKILHLYHSHVAIATSTM